MAADQPFILQAIVARFRAQKEMAEKAIVQLSDAQLRQPLDENTNSVAVIMKHAARNLKSRFTDFLTSDGEKPDRDRDSEFIDDFADRAAILSCWENGWECLFRSLSTLTNADLNRIVVIRGQDHNVLDALLRALAHQAYHAGQIVQLARFLAKDKWETITIPRGGSRQFNEKIARP
jgi:uncharacterized damage-inducible protein DinB